MRILSLMQLLKCKRFSVNAKLMGLHPSKGIIVFWGCDSMPQLCAFLLAQFNGLLLA